MNTLAFVVLRRNGIPYLIRRNQWLGYPFTHTTENEGVDPIIERTLGNLIYSHGPVDIIVTPTSQYPHQFEFDGQPIIAKFLVMTNVVGIPKAGTGSFDFGFQEKDFDVFVQFLEALRKPRRQSAA